MFFSLKDQVAIVTGGGSGIGLTVATRFIEAGAHVVIADLNDCSDVADSLGCDSYKVDVSDREAMQGMVDYVVAKFGALDVLINNAGVAWGAPIEEFPESGWDKVMDTNVKGPFFLTQKLLPQLEAAASFEEPARVINVGSVDGIKTPVFDNFSYGPSKAAIHHMTRVLAAHLIKRNIIVNAIAPGPFPTGPGAMALTMILRLMR